MIRKRSLFSYTVTIVYFLPHVTDRMTGPVNWTNGVRPQRIKDLVADNPFRGGVSLGGTAVRCTLSHSSPARHPPPHRICCLAYYFHSLPFCPLLFSHYSSPAASFFLRLLKCFSPALRFPDMHAYCGYLRSKRPSLGTQIGQQWLERDASLQFVLLKTYNVQIAVHLEPITLLLSS